MAKTRLVRNIHLSIEFRSVVDSYKTSLINYLDDFIDVSNVEHDELIKRFWSESLPILQTKKVNLLCKNFIGDTLSLVTTCYVSPIELRKAKIDSVSLEIR